MNTGYKVVIASIIVGASIWAIDWALSSVNLPYHFAVTGLIAAACLAGIVRLLAQRQPANSRQVEDELTKSKRALRALGQCNKATIRATEEADLLTEICRITVTIGGYHLAWVGFAEDDPVKTVKPAAQMGYEEDYLESVNITWADTERGRGPTGTAIRTGKPYVVRNVLTDPEFAPWREEATRRGYASVIGLPLASGGKPFGALTIYARDADAFDPDEVSLLVDLADDLAYGIIALRTRIKQRHVEKVLRKTEAKKQAILNAIPDMIVQISKAGIFKSVKPANNFEAWQSPDEMTGKHINDILPSDVAEQFLGRVRHALQTGNTQIFEYPLTINRAVQNYEARIVICNENEVTAIIRDITGRKTREAIVEEERARIARDLHDGLAQNLYFVGLKLDYLCKQVKGSCDSDTLGSELHALKKTVQANINEVRRTIFALRPVEINELGFGPAIHKYVTEFGEQANIDVKIAIKGDAGNLSSAVEPIFFRLIQEGLNNIAKHANAKNTRIEIDISDPQFGQLTITDDGIGFDPNALPNGNGVKMGLFQMRQRVTMLGGQFSIESSPLNGTTLKAEIPQ